MAKTTELTTKKSAQTPAMLSDLMAQDAGRGMEGTDKDAFAIPFIKVIQQLSPQVTEGKTGYNPKAKPGMLFNTVTGELYDGAAGIIFIPCAFQRRFIQWGPREGNGGFKGEWLPEDVNTAITDGRLKKSEDDGRIYVGEINPKKSDYLSDTRSHFGLIVLPSGEIQQVLLSLSSSQIKKSKQLMGILAAVRVGKVAPPTWYNKIKLTTTRESNDKGTWYGLKIEHAGFIETEALYEAGKAFNETILAGKAKVNYAEHDEADEGKF